MSRGFNGGHGRGWGYRPQRGEASGGGRGTYGREGGESNEPRFDPETMERGEVALHPQIYFVCEDELLRDLDESSVKFGLDWEMENEPLRPSNNVPETDVTWRRQSTTIGQPWTMDNAACSIADDAPTDVEEETTWGDTLEADELNDLDGYVDDAKQYPEFSTIPLDDEHADALFGSSALTKDSFVDESLADDLKCKRASPQVQELLEFRKKLPAFQRKDEFVELVKNHRVVVVSGLTGCGKSTQLPQAVLDDQIKRGDGSRTYLVCTQPRRISATSLAERVASERGENLNSPGRDRSVGYQIRLESRLPRNEGSLLYCTTGIVLRWWTSGAALERASHLFLDEIHERNVESDLLLILIRDLLKQRFDLRVILMSATLEAESFLNYFSEFGAVLLEISGRSFHVQEFFLEDAYQKIAYQPKEKTRNMKRRESRKKWYLKKEEQARNQSLKALRLKKEYSSQTVDELSKWRDDEELNFDLIVQLVRHLCETCTDIEGAILIFVPGMKEISDLVKEFLGDLYFAEPQFKLLPLHSSLPMDEQKAVFERPPDGCRKVIVSTNLAETSVTIDDVVFVIDTGLEKRQNFDKTRNCQTLDTQWESKANAVQRRGRAGRCQPGVCYHLFPSWKYEQMEERPEPEIRRTRLTSLCLDIKALTSKPPGHGVEQLSVLNFLRKAMDPPDEESVRLALDDLYAIGALTKEEILTPLGWHLTKLPVDPHCGKMMIYSVLFSCVDPVLTIAACLDYRSPFNNPFSKKGEVDERKLELSWKNGFGNSDHLMWVNAYNGLSECAPGDEASEFVKDNFLSRPTLQHITKLRHEFAELLQAIGFVSSSDPMDERVNSNSAERAIIETVIALGLYPNVVAAKDQTDIPRQIGGSYTPVLQLKNGRSVKIHPSSVNKDVRYFPTRYLAFKVAVKTSANFLRDCSTVSPLALCIAASQMQKAVNSTGNVTIVLDDWIKFKTDTENAYTIVEKLRNLLHMLFKWNLAYPAALVADVCPKDEIERQKELMRLVCMELQCERLRFQILGE